MDSSLRKTDHQKTGRRPAPFLYAGFIIAGISLLASVFLMFSAGALPDSKPVPTRGACLVLCAKGQKPGHYRVLETGLSLAGFACRSLAFDRLQDAGDNALPEEMTRLSADTGFPLNRIWLIQCCGEAERIWDMAICLPELAGLLLISPQGLEELDAAAVYGWPQDRSVVVATGGTLAESPESSGRMLFEYLTGEDARLMPADRQEGIGGAWQYTSISGRVHLSVYPALPDNLVLLSPRVLPDTIRWLDEWSDEPSSVQAMAQYGKTLIKLILFLILSGMFLLMVPLGLHLGLSSRFFSRQMNHQHFEKNTGDRWMGAVVWIPAAALAGGAGLLVSRVTGAAEAGLYFSLLILPGCRGWVFVMIRQLRQKLFMSRAKAGEVRRQKGSRLKTAAGIALSAVICATAAGWIVTTFGSLLPQGWPWLALPVLVLVNLPAALMGAPVQDRQTGLDSLFVHLPFLLLPIWAALAGGLTGLTASLVLLAVSLWSFFTGRAVMLLSRQRFIGSMAHALCYSMGALLPPIAVFCRNLL